MILRHAICCFIVHGGFMKEDETIHQSNPGQNPKHLVANLALAVGILLCVQPVSAQERDGEVAPSALPGIFGEVLDVRVINLEAVVTDKKGTPILGLNAEDFRLMVDDEEVPVEYFSEIRGGIALDGGGVGGPGGVPSLAPGEAVGTSYLVFIDEFFGIKRDRDRVLRALKDDLAYLQPEDRMAIVAYDGKELEMLSTWSSSQREIERTLNDASLRPSNGLVRIVERQRLEFGGLNRLDTLIGFDQDTGFSTFNRELAPDERSYIRLLTEQLNRSIASAAATLRSFAKPPGRKVLVLMSGGWPFVPTDYLVGDVSRALFDREGPYGPDLYARLIETANLLGYTIYPVDLPGLDREVIDASSSGLPARNGQDIGFLRESEAHSTLRYLADKTGGKALINQNRLSALEKVAADTRSYYWLGFSPKRAGNDEIHRIEIELRNPEFRVRSRGSYLDSSPATEVSMAVESTLLFGNAAAAGTLEVEVGDVARDGRRRMKVPLRISIPLDAVTFLASGDRFATRLELRVAVQDSEGQQAPIPIVPLDLTAAEMPVAGDIGNYETTLRLRRKPHQAVVAIHDPASGRIFSTGFEITP